MTEQNLIINGVDHAKFDLEWAKRGGVFVVKPKYMEINDETMRDYEFFYTFCAGKVICINDYDVIGLDDGSTYVGIIDSINNDGYLEVRMATPSECAEEGVEYIEPPMMWRDIESAPRDVLVLVKTDKSKVGCAIFESKTECEYFGLNPIDGTFTHWMPLPLPQPPKDE